MKTKPKPKSEFTVDRFIHWAETTTNYHQVPNRYWSKDWYRLNLKLKLIFDFLITQAKYQATEDLEVGQCSFGRNQLSELFNIPPSTIRRLLLKLEELNEITLQPNNKFTLITINYLSKKRTSKLEKVNIKNKKNEHQKQDVSKHDMNDLQNESEKSEHLNLKKRTSKLEKVNTPIDDNINDKIDDNNENKIFVFGKENNFIKEKKDMKQSVPKETKVKETKVKALFDSECVRDRQVPPTEEPKPRKVNIPQTILNIWLEEYLASRRLKYVVSTVDYNKCKSLELKFLELEPQADLDRKINYFRSLFKFFFTLTGDFYRTNSTLQYIAAKFNGLHDMMVNGRDRKRIRDGLTGNEPVHPDYDIKIQMPKKAAM